MLILNFIITFLCYLSVTCYIVVDVGYLAAWLIDDDEKQMKSFLKLGLVSFIIAFLTGLYLIHFVIC